MRRAPQENKHRPRARAKSLAAATVLGAALAGCFTNPINQKPVVNPISATGAVVRGYAATFTVSGSDPDQDHLDWTWASLSGDCPDPQDGSKWPGQSAPQDASRPTTYTVDASLTMARFCVWAFATDRYGAVGANNLAVDAGHNTPTANIKLLSPDLNNSYRAYTKFQLSGELSAADNDTIASYDWNIDQAPRGSNAAFFSCDETGVTPDPDYLRCFRADLPNQYVVSLVVTDSLHTASPPATIALNVLPDQPPCITLTEPDFSAAPIVIHGPTDSAGTLPDFTVIKVIKVGDDGDPFPADPRFPTDTVHFAWSYGKEGGPLTFVDNNDFFQLVIPSSDFSVGDTAIVRLEVRDRNAAAIDDILLSCGDAALCPDTPGNTCFQRVSWKVMYR